MELIAAIKRGDESSFEEAFKQRRERVYFYFLKKTKSEEDAKDLLQTTFLKLWQYRQSLSEEFSLDQHLFHIARTVFIDHLRIQNKTKPSSTISDNHSQTEQPSTFFDTQARLQSALLAMPDIRKKVFVLNRLEGYNYKEIADYLSISVKSVDNHITKALRQLRKLFILP